MTPIGNANPVMAKRIRLAGIFLLAALIVEAFSLLWSNPTAFLLFAGIGGALLIGGVGVFLYSLVSVPTESPSQGN
ncbi:MAG: hypothetical protein ABIP12_06460 [Terriglobales bacterium]